MIVLLKRQDRIDFVINRVAEFSGCAIADLKTHGKRKLNHKWRGYIIYILYLIADIPFKEIAVNLGYKISDFRSPNCRYLYEVTKIKIETNKQVRDEYNKLAAYLEIL